MNKEQQDKLWNDLPEEYKSCYSVKYKRAKSLLKDNPDNFTAQEVIRAIVPLFGEHNLNPKPPTPKTWEDVESSGIDISTILSEDLSYKIIKKNEACTKIAKLIELCYGGAVSEEEYDYKVFWNIVANRQDKKTKLNIASNYDAIGNVLTFRSYELAYEFMSHESNRKLVEQYYMM